MNIELAKKIARKHIKALARCKSDEDLMISGMLILEDAINGEITSEL